MVVRSVAGSLRPTHQGMDAESANRAARQVALALLHGNGEEAHTIIDKALERQPLSHSPADRVKMPLQQTGLSVRIVNLLETEGIYTVEQLLNTSRGELLSFPMLGAMALADILQAMRDLGFAVEED